MFQQKFSDRSAGTAKDRVEHSHIQYVGILQYHLSIQCCLWQYGLLSFKVRGTKWDIFLPKHSNFCCEIGFKGQVPRILERWSLVSDQICVKKIKKISFVFILITNVIATAYKLFFWTKIGLFSKSSLRTWPLVGISSSLLACKKTRSLNHIPMGIFYLYIGVTTNIS